MPHLERPDRGLLGIARLESSNHLPGLVAEPPFIVELCRIPGTNITAVARVERQTFAERLIELHDQVLGSGGNGRQRIGQLRWNRRELDRLGKIGANVRGCLEAVAQ